MRSGVLGKMYRDGDVICRQGEMGDCMYIVEFGKVELLQRRGEDEFCLGVLDIGDFFGESALFERDVRSATARAVGEACVLRLEKKAFMERAHEDASFVLPIMEKLIKRVRQLEAALVRMGESARIDLPAGR
jgi:CRP-like cAMP-binding protein